MRNECLRLVFITICLLALVACGSGRDDDDDTNATSQAEVAQITLSADPAKLPADGNSTSNIEAAAITGTGSGTSDTQPVSDVTISFSAQSGSLSSEKQKTDSDGIATVTYTAPSGVPANQTDTVTATSDNGVTDTRNIQIYNPRGASGGDSFGMSVEYRNISGFWKAHLEDTITINLADRFGIAVADGTEISFKTYNTGGYIETETVETSGGTASTVLSSSGTYTEPLEGFLSVTAETMGGASTRVSAIEITPSPDNNYIFIGTNGGGVYRSKDHGQTWECVSRSTENVHQGQNWMDTYIKGQNAIDVDPDDTNTVYTGTGYLGHGRVYRSIDRGGTWNSDTAEEWNGIYNLNHAVMSVVQDEGSDYAWIGTEGHGALYASNGEDFTLATNGLTHGTTVKDMVRVQGTTGASATLYAAAKDGVYRSTDGGQNWSRPARFSGDNISSLALHPSSDGVTDIIYAGTEESGVWISTDSGQSWSTDLEGLDSWGIKDVELDETHNYLYTATYSEAQNSSSKPTGRVYSHTLNSDGSFSNDDWSAASEGIASYPSDSDTLLPVHVIKYDPTKEQLYAGGEGINFYTAGSGLDQGSPQWETSNTGLSNLIMARMPVLFSGECSLDYYDYWQNETLHIDVYIQDINGNPPIEGSTFTATNKYEKEEGNETVTEEVEIYSIDYGDEYIHRGTHRDPDDPRTDIPYPISLNATNATGEIELVFTPTCQDSAPGCSGQEQSFTIPY